MLTEAADGNIHVRHAEALLKTGALQSAIFNSANFSSIVTDAMGVIRTFNVGAERMLGYTAAEVVNKITPADFHDPQEVIARATALSLEFATPIAPGFEALVFKASRGIEDIYEVTKVRKDGSRFPAVVSVTALRDARDAIIGYLLIGTDNTARNQIEDERKKLVLRLEEKNSELSGALARLEASEDRLLPLKQSIAGMLEGIWIIDRQWRYVYVNAAAARQGRHSSAELVGRTMMECYPGIDATPLFGAITVVMETRSSRQVQTEFEFADGTKGWFELSVEPDPNGILIRSMEITKHKQATEALRASEASYRRLFEAAKDGILILDGHTGKIEDVNPFLTETLGYTHAEFLGKQLWELGAFKDIVANQECFEELQRQGYVRYENLPLETKGGAQRFVEFVSNVYDVNGRQVIQCNIRDNTARKQAEEVLLQARALQSAIFNSGNLACIATDVKGVIQLFSVGAERMLGYTAVEVVNKITLADLHDPQEVIARGAALSLEFATPMPPGLEALVFKASRGIEDIYEVTKVRKDGSRFPALLSVTALRDAQDGIIGYLLISTDNTARKEVEEERKKLDQRLRDQHFYTRSLIESNIDALMTTDPRGVITDVNKQTEALTGCTRDELIGAPFKNYFTDAGRAEAGINRVLSEGKVTNYELTARARDGTLTVVSYNASTFHDRDRRLQGVFAAARDMTELKRFEQRLQRKNVELEEASHMKSEFLANMSHELRTPLNSIIGFSEVLRDGLLGPMTDQQRGFIGDIFGSGKHLLALINDILDLSKVEAGKMTLDLESVLVSSLLTDSLSVVREKAAAHHIRLDMDAAEGLGSIQGDARKVKQILYNLLSNAVKFTAEGGQVTLRAGRVPRAEVGQLSGFWTGRSFPLGDSAFAEFLKISVTDSGIGISGDDLERLFRPFSQIDSGLARKFEGTGLGLAMVKLLAELHGGAVAVESAAGQGSCFTVWLPLRALADGALASAESPPAARIAAPVGARIALVVERDFKSAELIRVQLEAEGFKVLHAASAEAALVLAVEQPLALITLDILLPNMDGWEFLSRIKQVPDLRRIPVVIISIAADRNKGFSLGAAAVMQKPISREELYESLVDVGLFPFSPGRTLTVLVVDDDSRAVELIAVSIMGMASTVLRAYGGREAIDAARRELPDVIVLDLIMPEVNGFDVVEALQEHPDTARIPILVVTAKEVTAQQRAKLNGYVTTIMEKAAFDRSRFTAEIRRAMSGRDVVA